MKTSPFLKSALTGALSFACPAVLFAQTQPPPLETQAPSLAPVTAGALQPVKLTLAQALDLSRTQNKELAVAQQNRAVSRARQSAAVSNFFPTIAAEFSAGTKKDRDPAADGSTTASLTVPREYNQYAGGLVLRQSLFSGFADYASYQAAGATVKVQDLALSDKQQSLRSQVIESYFEIQLMLAKIDAEEEVRKAREQQLNYAKDRFRSGAVTEIDVLRAQYGLESQKPIIESLRSDLEKKKLDFAHHIGLPLQQSFELAMGLEEAHAVLIETKFPTLPEALTQAMTTNPSLSALRAKNEEYEFQTSVSRGKHLPKLDLVLRAETRANLRENIGTPDSQRYSGMVELTVPLFTGLSSFAERSEVAAKTAALEAEFEVAKQQVLRDLNAALRDMTLSRTRANSGSSNVVLARRTVVQATAQYRAGTTTINTVMDAYAQLLQARNEYSQALFDGIKAVATIQTLIGVSTEPNVGNLHGS